MMRPIDSTRSSLRGYAGKKGQIMDSHVIDEFSTPNLDCLEPEQLKSLAKVFQTLAHYCVQKSAAIRYRRAGYIDSALRCESNTDKLYKELPNWARSW
jgi:hypothetical protein